MHCFGQLIALCGFLVDTPGNAGSASAPSSQPATAPASAPAPTSQAAVVLTASSQAAVVAVERFALRVADLDIELLLATTDPSQQMGAVQQAEDAAWRAYRLLDVSDAGGDLRRAVEAGGAATTVGPELFDLLSELDRLTRLSGGAYAMTSTPLHAAWRFEGAGTVPSVDALRDAQARAAASFLTLDAARQTAAIAVPGGLRLDEVRRAYVLERAAQALTQAGVRHFVLRAGGDVVVRGTKGSQPWMVGVQDPRSPGYFAALPASDQAVATVSDHTHAFIRGGVRYCDVLDPRTGEPARSVRSVTIIAPRAQVAAALASAVFVLGPDAGLKLVARLPQVEAIVVDSGNRVHLSEGLAGVVKYRPPTDGP